MRATLMNSTNSLIDLFSLFQIQMLGFLFKEHRHRFFRIAVKPNYSAK